MWNFHKKKKQRTMWETAEECRKMLHSGVFPKFEEMLALGYRKFLKPGDIAIDIGVHAGFHFDQLLECVGRDGQVIGFEPVPDFANPVIERHNGEVDIRIRALSVKRGRSSFLFMTKAPGESGFKERTSEMDRGAKPIYVEITTLDLELADLPKLDYIKIDTEGHEISALNGGLGVIRKFKPIISVEYGAPTYTLYGLTAESLLDWSEQNGYKIGDLFGNIAKDRDEWKSVCDHGYWDYFLIPNEKVKYWKNLFEANPTLLI
jgi:FkbM family methyltransferase